MESRGFDSSRKNEDSILGQPNMRVVVLDLFSIGGKITNRKLDLEGGQYVPWKSVVHFFFDEVSMLDHLTQ